MVQIFPNLKTTFTDPRKWILWKINRKLSTPSHIIVKLWKAKEKGKIWKAAREKQLITWRRLGAINDWLLIWKNGVWKTAEGHSQSANRKKKIPGIIYPAKLPFRNEDEIKSSPNLKKKRKRLEEHITSRTAFREYNRNSFGLKGSDTRRELKFAWKKWNALEIVSV